MELPTEKSKPATSINDFIFMIYGPPKVGKTTFCANFENALFIATEKGHNFQEVYKVDPMKWEDIRKVAKNLIQTDHKFKTVIIDVVDNAYKMCADYINRKNQIDHESDLGYGKGYALIKDEFMRVIGALSQKGLGVVFLSHDTVRELEESGIKRSYTTTTLSSSAAKVINGMCDFILYFHTDKDKNRMIRTKATSNINAGDRSGKLPELMPLDFKIFEQHIMNLEKPKQTKKGE